MIAPARIHRRIRHAAWCGLLGLLTMKALPAAEPAAPPLAIARPERADRVSFHREILPLLQANCLPCHNQTRAKAELVLETPATMLKGGESGPALIPGKPGESLVFQAAAHQIEELAMPPADNKANARDLTASELGLLWLWIEQGAQADKVEAATIKWQAIPTNWVSSFAVALTENGNSVAVARANRVNLYDVRTGRPTGHLSDPQLAGAAQRDLVNALVFSPNGKQLAAAGYREVCIWERQPVAVESLWPAGDGANWAAAGFSSDRSRLALLSAEGRLEVHNLQDGHVVGSWSFPPASQPLLAWSPDGRWLASSGTNRAISLVSVESQNDPLTQELSGIATALAWFDQGRQLAIAMGGTNTIQTWRLLEDATGGTRLEPSGERIGPASAVAALAWERGDNGAFVSAHTGGELCRWSADLATPVNEVRIEGEIAGIDPAESGGRYVATLKDGAATIVEFGLTNTISGKFGGDPRLVDALQTWEHELALSRVELARAGTLTTEAEAASKTSDEALAKAREKRDGHAKALADKEKELAQQREVEVAAAKERDELGTELQRVADAAQAADQALVAARESAKTTAEAEGTALVAAGLADRLKSELERVRLALSDSDSSEAATKIREAATAAASEAATRSARGNEARAAAEKAREELASRAFEAGRRKAEADRAQADLPPRKKQAEERLATAQKAIGSLKTQIEKARITLDGSTQDFALAEKAVSAAAATLAAAKAADEMARKRIAAAELHVKELEPEIAQAATVPPALTAVTPDGNTLLTVTASGLASLWALPAGVATSTFALPAETPLALTGTGEHEFLAVYPARVIRINTSQSWTLQRTLGGAEAPAVSGPFIDRVNALAFSPDGQVLATGGGEPSRGSELKLWRVSDGELIRDLGSVHSDTILAIAFSPRGEWLATGGADRFGRITPLEGDGPRINLEGHTHHVLGVAWQADGSTLATAGADGVVKLWNPATGERRKNVEGFGKEVTGLRPVGITNQFVAVSGSGQGRVFRADGEKVRDLAAAPAFLQTLSATRDGRWVAGAGDDGVLRIWDSATGDLRLSLPPE